MSRAPRDVSREPEGIAGLGRPPGLAVALLLLAPVVSAGCQRCAPDSPEAPDPAAATIGSPEGAFVGSRECAPCHAEEYRDWIGSRHRSTLRPFSKAEPPRLAHASLPEGHRVEPSGAVSGPGQGGAVRGEAAYVVGGRRREEILVRLDDGRLQVFPFAYDVDGDKVLEVLRAIPGGRTPPGDTVDFWTGLGRNADLGCYGCHATGAVVRIAGATPMGNAVPRSQWAEAGVGCEACHGPGSPHVEAARRGKADDARTAIGLDRDPVERVAACAACHALREILSSPVSQVPVHPYGLPLWAGADPVLRVPTNAEFRDPFFPDMRPATYQQEAAALAQSPCAVKGGLECGSCHDPHSGTLHEEALDGEACLPCHEAIAALGSGHTRHPAGEPGSRCLDCHMAAIVRGPGSALVRDHSLSSPAAEEGDVPTACVVCHVGPEEAPRLVEGWKAFPRQSKEADRRRRLARALTAWQRGEGSPAAALAPILADPGEGWLLRSLAAALLSRTEAGPASPDVVTALRNALGDPNPALRRAAAQALGRWGSAADRPELVSLLKSPDGFLALAAVVSLARLGDPESGGRLTGLLGRPDLLGEYRAQHAIGAALLYARDWTRAEQHLSRGLELHPFQVSALNDLGVALYGEGKADAARAFWRRALEINPRFEAARMNLEERGSSLDK